MNKLYGLYVVDDEVSFSRFVAASNDVDKLKAVIVTPSNSFTIPDRIERERSKLELATKDDVYPKFLIYEVPYIC